MVRYGRTGQGVEAYEGIREHVPAGIRRLDAVREIEVLKKKGVSVSPATVAPGPSARTFWGKAWCDNLEAHSDFAFQLPKGRTYVRSGSVHDLQIYPARLSARVQGLTMYAVEIGIRPVDEARWDRIVAECAGRVETVADVLKGQLSGAVMEIIARPETGLFPEPRQVRMKCSCPDWAAMCEHVAAVLYAVGARLDEKPEMLFRLREVDPADLVTAPAHRGVFNASRPPAAPRALVPGNLSVLGMDLGRQAEADRSENDGPRPVRRVIVAAPPPPVQPSGPSEPEVRAAEERPMNGREEPRLVRLVRGAKQVKPGGPPRRTDVEFRKLGVPDETVAYWVRIGALEPAGEGAYHETPLAKERLGRYLARV